MQNSQSTRPVGDTMLAASRQVWLAGLGAAVVTREWAGKEAGQVLRTLVREGTVVESRAIRFVGERVETSVTRANALWRQARATLQSTVRDYAGNAVTLVRQTLPRALPHLELPALLRDAKPAARHTRRVTKTRTVKAAKTAKNVKTTRRSSRTAAKRTGKR